MTPFPSPRLVALGLAFASAAVALPASAADTLTRIRETRTINLGVREAARPFSFMADGKGAGYTVELCLAAVEDLKKELKLPELKVNYVTVTGADRIPKLQGGEIDLECGSTTNTKARQAQVAFSYTVFVAGMKVLVPKGTRVETLKDLDGMTIALSKGTTSEKLFTQLNQSGEAKMRLVSYAGNAEAFQALREGKARAFPQDDALLQGLASKEKALDALGLSAMAFSVEPYGIMLRKDDTRLAEALDRTLGRLFTTGEVKAIYRKWFETDTLSIPMNRLTRDGFVRPNKEAGVAMLLGYSI